MDSLRIRPLSKDLKKLKELGMQRHGKIYSRQKEEEQRLGDQNICGGLGD